jgi:hypothetical protein
MSAFMRSLPHKEGLPRLVEGVTEEVVNVSLTRRGIVPKLVLKSSYVTSTTVLPREIAARRRRRRRRRRGKIVFRPLGSALALTAYYLSLSLVLLRLVAQIRLETV